MTFRRLLALLAALAATPWPAIADDLTACNAAIAAAEHRSAMPKRVMGTIALVESGRIVGKRVVPWPWSINVGGTGYYYETKEAAIEAVRTFTAAGQRSIDVGCMQINLAAHPAAFDSLDTAFEPTANAEYAARFLRTLYQQSGRFATAMTAYHSQTPEFANDYARRLLAVWPGAADLGLTASTAAPAPKQRSSQINLDTEGGRALNARPVALRLASARASSRMPSNHGKPGRVEPAAQILSNNLEFWTDMADGAIMFPLGIAVPVVLALLGQRRAAVAWTGAIICAWAVMLVFKLTGYTIAVLYPASPLSAVDLVTPSGHVASSAAIYGGLTGLLLTRPGPLLGRSVLAAILFAVAIGATRVLLGMHSLAEVVVGATVGIAAAAAIAAAARTAIDRRASLSLLAVTALVIVSFHGNHTTWEGTIRDVALWLTRTWSAHS